MGLYYRAQMWQSEATWRRADVCLCDTWTCVCACERDVCALHRCVCVTRICGIINGLGAFVIELKLTLKIHVSYKRD